jgi:hypothetical protein
MKKKKIIIRIIVLIVVVMLVFTGVELIQNNKIVTLPSRPENGTLEGDFDQILLKVKTKEPLTEADYEELSNACAYIDGRYDCSDFRLQSLLRLLYESPEVFEEEQLEQIKKSLLGFKYWMDQPGEDSMCLWSENHQILFAASEYLVGALYPEDMFTNDGLTGEEHMEIARERIHIWLEQRWLYGFTEWYSNTYYVEDIAPLSNLIDFSEDEEITIKSQIIMDLLLYDLATQSYQGNFVSTSGRMYESGKKAGENNSMRGISESIWDYEVGEEQINLGLNFRYITNYEVPSVIKNIGYDHENVVIKASNGLDVSELEEERLVGQETNQIMMQWAMEAFTNPEVIQETMTYIHKNQMLSNEFLNDFRWIDLSILRWTKLLPIISKQLNMVTDGVAIQRANTYTYRTDDYMMATAQAYHPGGFGDQQHIWTATIDGEVSIFTTHPAKSFSEEGALSNSPSYWVGNGRNPYSVQDENINMTLYKIGTQKGFMEENLVQYTHAYFPENRMDQVVLEENYIFGRKGDTWIGMIGRYALTYVDENHEDLRQDGETTFWITELSSKEVESFEAFRNRIKNNEVTFEEDELILTYTSNETTYEMIYDQMFSINEEPVVLDYQRFDSKYSQTSRKPETITFTYEEETLFLDFYNQIR